MLTNKTVVMCVWPNKKYTWVQHGKQNYRNLLRDFGAFLTITNHMKTVEVQPVSQELRIIIIV